MFDPDRVEEARESFRDYYAYIIADLLPDTVDNLAEEDIDSAVEVGARIACRMYLEEERFIRRLQAGELDNGNH